MRYKYDCNRKLWITDMSVHIRIIETLDEALQPEHLEVINESGMHNVPKGSETHFKVIAVSEQFSELSLIARHRAINELLADELAGPIHALSLHTMTPGEWLRQGQDAPDSPLCLGGAKREQSA